MFNGRICRAIVAALVLVGGASVVGCRERTERTERAVEDAADGSVDIALVTVGSEGNRYRLREAQFQIDGPLDVSFSAEEYLGQERARFDLPVGTYAIQLA